MSTKSLLLNFAKTWASLNNFDIPDDQPVLIPYYVDSILTEVNGEIDADTMKHKIVSFNGNVKKGFFNKEYTITNFFPTVMSDLGTNKGKCVFQMIVQTPGLMQIGMTSRTDEFDRTRGIGDFKYSFAYDGWRTCVWNEGQTTYGPHWKKGDVVSFCVDFDQRNIRVFLNDKDLGIAFDKFFDGQELPVFYFGVTGTSGQSFIINYGEYPLLFKEKFEEYQPIAQQPHKGNIKEAELLEMGIIDCLQEHSDESILVLSSLLSRYISLIVNSKVICIKSFIHLLQTAKDNNILQELGTILKHGVHEEDLEAIFETLMEWYYITTSHYSFDSKQVTTMTELILDVLAEMMVFACKDSPMLFDFVDLIITKSSAFGLFDYASSIKTFDLSTPPLLLVETLNEKYKKQLNADVKLLLALDRAHLLNEFILTYSDRHSPVELGERGKDKQYVVTLRIVYALFHCVLEQSKTFNFSNEFLKNTPTEFPDFDRLGGIISYIVKTFPIEDNKESLELHKNIHRAMLFFYKNANTLFNKMELLCRKDVGFLSTLEKKEDWFSYFWNASNFVLPVQYTLQIKMCFLLVNALKQTDAFCIPISKDCINQNKETFSTLINLLIEILGNTLIVKPNLKTTIFLSLTNMLTKRMDFIEFITSDNKKILFDFVFNALLTEEDERIKRALSFIRIAFPIPFYLLRGNIAASRLSKTIFRKLLDEYFEDKTKITKVHTIVFEYITKNLDKILLLLDKERLSNDEEKLFEMLSSCLLDGTDLLSGLSVVFPHVYHEHAFANKLLQFIAFILYQCIVRNSTTRRGKVIHKIFASLRILVLDILGYVLQSFPEEKRIEWMLQDDFSTATWDKWRPVAYVDDIITEMKLEEKKAFESIQNVIAFLKKVFDQLQQHTTKTVVVKPTLQGRTSSSSFEVEVEDDEEKLCFICCSNLADTIMLPCKHSACRVCINRHMETHNDCFFCKAKIEELKDREEMGMQEEAATTN
ncbi:SPRY domain containing protein [Entamoeba marina]